MTQAILSDLARMKALFQLRAVCAHMGLSLPITGATPAASALHPATQSPEAAEQRGGAGRKGL